MSIRKKNILKPNRSDLTREKTVYDRLGSWQAVFAAAAMVWLISCFPPAADIVKHMSFEIGGVLLLVYGVILVRMKWIKKNATPEKVYALILFGSLVLRAFVALVMNYQETNHDVGAFLGEEGQSGTGFFGYIEYICTHGHLPDFDPRMAWSFYNPPGFPLLAAAVLKLTMTLGVETPYCYEALQCVPFLFSALTIWVMGKILKEFPIRDGIRNLLLAVLAFHPHFHISGATLTNDAMATFFSVLCVWLTLRWYREQRMKYILPLALSLGLAMFTKLNAGLIGFGIAFVFLYAFFTNLKSWKGYVPQYLGFLAVSVPLAFYNPVKNKLLYGMPLFYVQQLPVDNPQRITGINGLDRVFLPGLEALMRPFSAMNPNIESNIWTEMIRSSLFDERYSPEMGLAGLLATALFWGAILLAIWSFAVLVKKVLLSKTLPMWQRGFVGISYFSALLSYVVFCYQEPYICTMHFRYIATLIIFPAIAAGVWLSEPGEEMRETGKTARILGYGFAALSAVMVLWLAVFARLADM